MRANSSIWLTLGICGPCSVAPGSDSPLLQLFCLKCESLLVPCPGFSCGWE
jgi:hypothetical protein